MSFLKTLNSMRCCKALLNPAVPSPVFRLPTLLCSQQICAPRKITEFSKKTGDYTSLSAVDIQVMALTYQLEKEHVGSDHLHSEPRVERVSSFSEQSPSVHLGLAGFYMPPQKTNCLEFEIQRGRNEAVPKERENNYVNKKSVSLQDTEKHSCWYIDVLKTAPEDVEEEKDKDKDDKDKDKLIYVHRFGEFLNRLFVPEDVEEDDKLMCVKQKGKYHLYAPEDVDEDDEKDKKIYLNFNRKLQNYVNVPEDVEEDEIYKSVDVNFNKNLRMPLYTVNKAPEDVDEDETKKSMYLTIRSGNFLRPLCPATYAPEDVEEDEIHKSILITSNGKFLKHSFPVSPTAVPEDVDEDDEKRKPNNLFKYNTHSLKNLSLVSRTVNGVPEDVEDEEPKSFHSLKYNGNLLKHLSPALQNVKNVPEDVEENEIYKSTGSEDFLLYTNVAPRKDNFMIPVCV